MKKDEAVEVMNEILKVCVLPRYLALNLSNPQAPAVEKSYEIQIKGLSSDDWYCLKEIVQKRKLGMKETSDYTVIFKQEE